MAKFKAADLLASETSSIALRAVSLARFAEEDRGERLIIFALPPASRQRRAQARRHRRGDRNRRAVLVERHDDSAGVQMERRPVAARGAAVDCVAEDRPAHFRAVDPELVRAAGQRLEREPGQFPTPLVGEGRAGGRQVGRRVDGCAHPRDPHL